MVAKKKKPAANLMNHKVHKIGTRGKFLLVECRNCQDRRLVVDKAEAEKMYGKFLCRQ